MKDFYKNKDILVTGGAGSIGSRIVHLLTKYEPKRIRVLDINETGQYYLQQSLNEHSNIRYFVGDVTRKEKVKLAMKGVDIVFHCAALKHVPSCEYNPFEAVNTNVLGLNNVISSCKEEGVKKCIYISTDKAVEPENIMGITKLLGEKLVTNSWTGEVETKFASVRFGNVLNSNGSVIPLFKKQIEEGKPITLTHPDMTRFFMTIDEAAGLVLKAGKETEGRETYILKMKAMKIFDLADALIESMGKEVNKKIIGIRPGEKLYEKLLTDEEAKLAENLETSFKLKSIIWAPHHISEIPQFREEIKKEEYDSREAKLLSKEEITELLKSTNII